MSGAFHADAAVVFPSIATASQWPLLAWAALGVVLLLAAVSSYGWWRATRPVERPLTRLRVDLGPDAVRAPRDSVALSPDGTRIVFVGRASESGTRQLFTRRLDEQTAQPLPGTTFGASLSMPFFSPAGDWIAFLAGNSLRKVSVQGGSIVEVAGHLVFVRQGTLFAVPFDPTRLETRGTPTPLLNEVGDTGLLEGGAQFTFSTNGTFVYLERRTGTTNLHPISWLSASGQLTPLLAQPGAYTTPRLSPDGSRLAYSAAASKGGDLWIYDLQRGAPTQLTFTGPGFREVAWAPDSRHLVYGDGASLWWIRADGSGQPQRILEKASNPRPSSFSPDGRLVYSPFGTQGLPDIWTLPVDLRDPEHPKPGKAEPFLSEPAVEVDPAFSPDGKFIAYASTELGPNEVFVRPFPGPGGKWKVSTTGGKFPAWAATTRELFFVGGDDRILVASYTINGDSFVASPPRPFAPTQVLRDGVRQNFDVTPDGKRVVVFPRPMETSSEGPLHATFLLNFFDEVRRRVP